MNNFWTYETELPGNAGYSLYGFAHISYTFLCLLLVGLGLFRYIKIGDKESRSSYRKIVAFTSVFLIIIRIIYLLIINRMSVYELPIHLCSIAGILCFVDSCISPKLPKWTKVASIIRRILYTVCLPGLICAVLFPNGNYYPAISFISIQSYLFHGITILYVVLILREGMVKPELINVLYGIVFLFVLAPIVYLLNRLMGTNYLFIMLPSNGSPLMLLYDGISYLKYLVKYFIVVVSVMSIMNLYK